jgi:hypothetical protein
MKRLKEWRIFQTQKKIKKRLEILERYRTPFNDFSPQLAENEPHRLHKWNLTCDCPMCNAKKFFNKIGNSISKKLSYRDKKLREKE